MKTVKKPFTPERRLTVAAGMLFLFLSLSACSLFGDKQPDWISGPSAKYPESSYILGVGHGDSERSAEKNAVATIVQPFRTPIKGAEIVETWVDSTKQVYKLAILDRRKTARMLGDRIEELNGIVNRYDQVILDSADKLMAAQSYEPMIQTIKKRDTYDRDYRTVNLNRQGHTFEVTLGKAEADLQNFLAKEFSIAIKIIGPNAEQVRAVLAEYLTAEGFSILGQSTQTANIIIKGKLAFKKLDMPSKHKFIQWHAVFQLINQANNKEFGTILRKGREVHVSYQAAEQAALETLIKQIDKNFAKDIFAYVFGN